MLSSKCRPLYISKTFTYIEHYVSYNVSLAYDGFFIPCEMILQIKICNVCLQHILVVKDCYVAFINMEDSMEMHSFACLVKNEALNIISVYLHTN